MGASTTVSNVVSWIIAVTLMFILNKFWVFKTKSKNKKDNVREFISFMSARIFTLIIDEGIVYLFVDKLGYNDLLIKIISQIIVIVLNYVFSKLWIFKKKEKV